MIKKEKKLIDNNHKLWRKVQWLYTKHERNKDECRTGMSKKVSANKNMNKDESLAYWQKVWQKVHCKSVTFKNVQRGLKRTNTDDCSETQQPEKYSIMDIMYHMALPLPTHKKKTKEKRVNERK